MALKLITPPEPVLTWEDAVTKLHLRVEGDEDQALVELYIAAATAYLDGYSGILGRAIGVQTWDLIYDAFPGGAIKLPLAPVLSVTGIYYADADGIEQTISTDDYYVDTASSDGWVVPAGSWPTPISAANAVRVRFVAGYEDVPADIVTVILLLTAHWYRNREAATQDAPSDIPFGASALISKLRRMSI